jgi:aspartyl protease family protein
MTDTANVAKVKRARPGCRRAWLVVVCLVTGLALASAVAGPAVRVLALFPGKAMLDVDGKRKVLAAGEALGGVVLVSADTETAVVEIDGAVQELRLGSSVSATYRAPEKREIRILKGRGGYFIDGLINGQPVTFLVDTGATSVALGEDQARRLGLQHRVEGQRIGVGTASGSAVGHRITLRSLVVGGARLSNVGAVVIEGDGPRHVLLGMNVLSRFELDQRENLLIMRTRY